jgi:NADH-quinone oxidoreductase subunit F
VWAGGDAVSGPSTVIEAIRAGRDAARSIDETIRAGRGEPVWEPPVEEEIFLPPPSPGASREGGQLPIQTVDGIARRRSWNEVESGYGPKLACAEASRCLRCDADSEPARRLQGV